MAVYATNQDGMKAALDTYAAADIRDQILSGLQA